MSEAPTKKLKTAATCSRTIIHSDEFNLLTDSHYAGEMRTNKTGRKFAPLQVSPYDESKVLIQFNGGGSVPPFGISADKEREDGAASIGKSFIYNLDHEQEVASLRQLNDAILQLGIANKNTWWPKGITNEQIKDNLTTLFTEKKLKNSGDGYWPAQMKVKIPMDDATGSVKTCDIKNTDDVHLSLTDLPGTKWDTLVVELAGFFFSGKYTWGVVKQLFKVRASCETKVEKDPKKVPFLPKKNLN